MTSSPTASPLIVLATFGSLGDLRPFVLVATALQRRGHRVMLLAPAFLADAVATSGVPHRLYGLSIDSDALLAHPDLWHPRKGVGLLLRHVVPCIAEVASLLADVATVEPCVLIGHPLLLPAADIVRVRCPGLRAVGAWLAPLNLRTCDDPLTIGSLAIAHWVPRAVRQLLWWGIDRFAVDPMILPGLNALRAVAGLPPLRGFVPHLAATCDASLALFPAWLGPHRQGWPAAFVYGDFPLRDPLQGEPLPEGLTTFLSAGAAPVVFTAGTGMRQAKRFFENAAHALRQLNRRGVFVTTHEAQVPAALPADIHWQPFVDFGRLLPRAAAIVHHGGIGTTAEALRAGVPQLVVPFGFDQFDNGHRVRRLGVGDVLPASRAEAGRLARVLRRLLASTTISARCRAIAGRFGGADAATLIADAAEAALAQAASSGLAPARA